MQDNMRQYKMIQGKPIPHNIRQDKASHGKTI